MSHLWQESQIDVHEHIEIISRHFHQWLHLQQFLSIFLFHSFILFLPDGTISNTPIHLFLFFGFSKTRKKSQSRSQCWWKKTSKNKHLCFSLLPLHKSFHQPMKTKTTQDTYFLFFPQLKTNEWMNEWMRSFHFHIISNWINIFDQILFIIKIKDKYFISSSLQNILTNDKSINNQLNRYQSNLSKSNNIFIKQISSLIYDRYHHQQFKTEITFILSIHL